VGALIALLLTLAPDAQVKGMLFWLIGDLGGATVAMPALATLAVALAVSFAFARDLNVLSRGEDVAAALGVPIGRTMLVLCALAATRDSGGGHHRRQRGLRRTRRPARAAPSHGQRPAAAAARPAPSREARCCSSPTRSPARRRAGPVARRRHHGARRRAGTARCS
jgi:hypothetical protein